MIPQGRSGTPSRDVPETPNGRLRIGDEPDAADALTGRVAGLRVSREVIQRRAVVGHLVGAIVALDRRQGAGHAVAGLERVICLDDERWPVRGAIAVAHALARRRVLLEDVEGLA